ncbi:type II toxin-antitoxin system PemK/MazF family toxin [Pseudarthrobacter sp. C4D7]|uniref:type II toxin-antitoxin system PemK/MazF family toxin n=1 Tax=Pseudarthrobacter sp. C4D7 TaxID=2735268 RepID=UPI0015845217|nr:type II toxin-antitoxin system PemK/MazF family toxin [Pseudarthrobacter sp. C4D7]NUT72056.1 type II toxin-antitoxin system PemK/MazF family toxin [Pseudarthrobacter sp. C4D7]
MAFDLHSLGNAVRRALRMLQKGDVAQRPSPTPGVRAGKGPYPGDYTGRVSLRYAPQRDGEPDPGEVVWAWVPYEEDHGKGKDRPVLVVGHNGPLLLGLMLTSRDRVPAGMSSGDYMDLGPGGWDRQGRPSEVRLDRILQIHPSTVRREGAVLDEVRFEKVAAGLRRRHGWS